MPNWEPNYCIEHSINNDRRNTHWLGRDDTHCFHGSRCCWCGIKIEVRYDRTDMIHGKYAPKSKKKCTIFDSTVSDLVPEEIK